jgi:hypothetical protein
MICGKYVKTFREASHALPDGMHMSADYPFMLPRIKALQGNQMTITGSGGAEAVVEIVVRGDREFAFVEQSSSFERLYKRPPQRFELHPFKDESTPAVTHSIEASK